MGDKSESNRESADYLSTIGKLDPLEILAKFDDISVVLVAIVVETRSLPRVG